MAARQRDIFLTVKTEGAVLPADLLQRIIEADSELGGLTPGAYHLGGGEKLTEATSRSWNRLLATWSAFQGAREKLAIGDPGTKITREHWLLPLFQELGYGRLLSTKAVEIDSKSYAISHGWNRTAIHLLGCRVDLDRPTPGLAGASRSSPHSLLQELLNRSPSHLWGFVSNGLRLRILRDNATLTRQAYVEFDLEALMLGEVYSDFVLLWLLCHESRVEAERPEECWLEKWSQASKQRGVRALDQLREGVETAIKALGRGFLSWPGNRDLRERLRSGELVAQEYYRQVLRLVYRLLFLFAAEDRDLLLLPGEAHSAARERYWRFYSTIRLRRLAERRTGTRHSDLYTVLRLVMNKLGSDTGCLELALPALGGFLFSDRALPDIENCEISNHDLLGAVRALAIAVMNGVWRSVDYKNLGAEELGSVYESLLELHPRLDLHVPTFDLEVAAGHERKTTGSYYTPTSLVERLLDSVLNSVLDDASTKSEPEAAILKLKVVDPACGSGHFLIAVAHRIAKRLASVRTGDDEPSPEALRTGLRDVIGHCIYGVDVNPMAVELCKVNLWLEALEPGKPLSFLEHRIQIGHSLLGTTPRLLEAGIPDEAFQPIEGDLKEACTKWRKVNKDERKAREIGAAKFPFEDYPWLKLGNFAQSLMKLDNLGDDTIEGIRAKANLWEQAIRSSGYLDGKLLADTWCAAFVWKKDSLTEYPVTEDVFRRIERNPHTCEPRIRQEVARLTEQYRFFHWHLAFPDVFCPPTEGEEPGNTETGWSGGFDAVLGNPPWEMPEIDDRQFFWNHNRGLAQESSARKRAALIRELMESDPPLYTEWIGFCRRQEGERLLFSSAGILPYAGKGRLNYCRLFIELCWNICSRQVGIVVASGLATKEYDQPLWHRLLEQGAVTDLYDFVNTEHLFPAVDDRQKFMLLTLSRTTRDRISTACWLTNPAQIRSRKVELLVTALDEFSPGSRFLPQFSCPRDLELLQAVHNRFPPLASQREWGYMPRLMFSSSDKAFAPVADLEARAWETALANCRRAPDGRFYVPVYEGKMVGIYDHRQADIYLNPSNLHGKPRNEKSLTTRNPTQPDLLFRNTGFRLKP